MNDLNRNNNDVQSLADLEAELRQLPQVRPPVDLEAKLISAIPAVPCSPRGVRSLRWTFFVPLTAAAAAVAVCIVAYMFVGKAEVMPRRGNAPASMLADTRASHVLDARYLQNGKETDPCNILPQLRGQWY